ncbi:MAG: insulinase family protein, partial [Oxalobacter sp.]|nr:insulinase family protein [Oxalobacter sp.]
AYKAPALRDVEKDDDVYALRVLSSVLDGYENARMKAELVLKEKIALDVETEYTALARGPSLFVISAIPAKGVSVEKLEKRMRKSVADIAEKGVSPAELKRVKTQLVASQIYKRDSMFGQAMEIGLYEMSGIGCQQADRVIEKLKAVTPEQVKRVAGQYFHEDQLTVAELVPVALPKQPEKK